MVLRFSAVQMPHTVVHPMLKVILQMSFLFYEAYYKAYQISFVPEVGSLALQFFLSYFWITAVLATELARDKQILGPGGQLPIVRSAF